MESFKKWMDRVVGKRPDITADWSTTTGMKTKCTMWVWR